MALTGVQHSDKAKTDKAKTDKKETDTAGEATLTPPNGNPK